MAAQFDLNVVSNEAVTLHMRRVVLEGESLEAFPGDQESGYVKLMLTPPAAGDADQALLRSYTIRRFDPYAGHLTLDFVDHGDNGPASAWARRAKPGDAVSVRGPGEKKLVDPGADWYLLAGDMSALPALSVNLESLARDARGYAFIEVLHEDDRQVVEHPQGIKVVWLINPDPATANQPLVKAVLGAEWLPGRSYPWFAGEFEAMRRVRRYFRDERGIDRRAMYVSCYWKIGDTDEGMKRAKKMDPQQ